MSERHRYPLNIKWSLSWLSDLNHVAQFFIWKTFLGLNNGNRTQGLRNALLWLLTELWSLAVLVIGQCLAMFKTTFKLTRLTTSKFFCCCLLQFTYGKSRNSTCRISRNKWCKFHAMWRRSRPMFLLALCCLCWMHFEDEKNSETWFHYRGSGWRALLKLLCSLSY